MPAVLITGAAHGLGKATAGLFISKGWTVILIDQDERIHNTFEGELVYTYQCDVTDGSGLQAIRDDLSSKGLSIKVLINNAGYFLFLPITDCDVNELERIFQVNAMAPIRLINLFRNDLEKNGGRVIQVSSENVKMSGIFQPYPSSKIALESLSEAARQELSLLGVSLIIIRPGAIRTRLLEWEIPESEVYGRWIKTFIENARSRMGKVAKREKVADVIWKAATAAHPRRMYQVNHNPWLSVFARLPVAFRERIILRIIRGNK